MTDSYLVIVDADKIHDYVFAPQQLKLIRGGSAIQAALNRRLLLSELLGMGLGDCNVDPAALQIKQAPSLDSNPGQAWEAVYAGGGTALVLFRDKTQAQSYAHRAEQLFRVQTAAATASSALVKSEDSFKRTYLKARCELETAKTARTDHQFQSSTPYWKICDFCGRYPAARRHRTSGGERYPCAACVLRLKNSEKAPFLEDVRKNGGVNVAPPSDFEQLGKKSKPENWLALVYIDVNRLGRFLVDRASASPAVFREYSNAIHATVVKGVIEACVGLCAGLRDEEAAPFEVLLVGGDDAIIMLCAQHVFHFLRTFEAAFRGEPLLKDLDYSVGVVWAHQHFPVSQFLAHAEGLLKSSKRRAGGGFSVDYSVVSESLAGETGPRDKPYTRKPYSLEEFGGLAESLAEWKRAGVPATKVKELHRFAYLSRNQAILDYFFLLSRLERRHRELVSKQFFGGELWDEAGRTSAADLVELWDFVEAG